MTRLISNSDTAKVLEEIVVHEGIAAAEAQIVCSVISNRQIEPVQSHVTEVPVRQDEIGVGTLVGGDSADRHHRGLRGDARGDGLCGR